MQRLRPKAEMIKAIQEAKPVEITQKYIDSVYSQYQSYRIVIEKKLALEEEILKIGTEIATVIISLCGTEDGETFNISGVGKIEIRGGQYPVFMINNIDIMDDAESRNDLIHTCTALLLNLHTILKSLSIYAEIEVTTYQQAIQQAVDALTVKETGR
jgi:hypothetical protein